MLIVEGSWQSIADWTRLPDISSSGVGFFAGQFGSKKKKERKKLKGKEEGHVKKSTFGTFGAFYKITGPKGGITVSRSWRPRTPQNGEQIIGMK